MSSMMFRRWLPIGAIVLATVAAACGGDQAAPFEVEGTGNLTGRLFFDADRDGVFTPLAGDTVLPNVEVEVRERGTAEVLATTFTDDEGVFTFEGLPPGTHDVVGLAADGTDIMFCSPVPASVYRNEMAFALVAARTLCIQLIKDVERGALEDPVNVVGVVIVAQGTFRSDQIHIQDTTSLEDSVGATIVFGVPALGLVVGDRVEVSGFLGQFNTERQIVRPIISNRLSGFEFDTTVLTTDSILSIPPGDSLIHALVVGRLIRINGVKVAPFDTLTDRNSAITDSTTDLNNTARVELRLDGNVYNPGTHPTVPPSGAITQAAFDPAKCYDIIGVLSLFTNTRQIKPRIASDIIEVACPAAP